MVGYQRTLADYTKGRFRLALSYLRAITRTLQKHGVQPREGLDVFNQDQLIWVFTTPTQLIKIGASVGTS